MIGIIEYGLGNIFSLQGALKRLDLNYIIASDNAEIDNCTALILPGVGAFGDAMNNLKAKGLDQKLIQWSREDKPLLGICLGMQLLFEKSEEHGDFQGLGIIDGQVKKIPPGIKVPHMGWNLIDFTANSSIFRNCSPGYAYFVHSYYAQTNAENIIAKTTYSVEIPAIVGKGKTIGMQFHPEKSSKLGTELLKAWAESIGQLRIENEKIN